MAILMIRSKRITLGIINLLLGGVTLYYWISVMLSKSPADRLEIAFKSGLLFFIPAILALISGTLTLLGKHWIWSIVGFISIVACWIVFFILLVQGLSKL